MIDETAPLVAVAPTPVHPLPRLAAQLGMPADCLWIKRDDLTGLAGGGNKARKLAKLVEAALAEGADCLVTGGGTQSNHARMTAAAAAVHGLGSVLVLNRPDTPDNSGNVLLDRILGADIRWVEGLPFDALEDAIVQQCDELTAHGRRPYRIPVGGSSPLGASAYADVARELDEQIESELVVVATGSCGTHAGLAAGFGDHGRVFGVDVGAHPDPANAVTALAIEVSRLAALPLPFGTCQVDGSQVGDGYARPTDAALEALHLTARSDGILLDPVYTAKAMAGLFAARRDGRIEATTRVVFLHTGGLPGLLAQRYADWAGG